MATFVLVHGICHGGWCWEPVTDRLRAAGHTVAPVDLELTSLAADAAVVTRTLDELDGPKVLVGHSYGGLVISRAAGGRDDLAHLVYVAAVLVPADDVFLVRAMEHPSLLAERGVIDDDGIVTVDPDAALACFYNTSPPELGRAAAARLRPTAVGCLAEGPGAEPWRRVPTTYVRCEHDQAVHPDLQAEMSALAGTVVHFATDHSPFLADPDGLTAVLTAAAPS